MGSKIKDMIQEQKLKDILYLLNENVVDNYNMLLDILLEITEQKAEVVRKRKMKYKPSLVRYT